MVQRIFLVFCSLCAAITAYTVGISPISPAPASTNSSLDPVLVSSISDIAAPCKVSFFYRKAPPAVRSPFSIIVLPDTQNYTSFQSGGSPDIFVSQTEWIVTNSPVLNPAAVLHVGDMIQHNGSEAGEFEAATNAMYRLEDPLRTGRADGIPYLIAPGNHDGYAIKGYNEFNRFFGVEHFKARSYYGGHYGTNNCNSFILFSAAGMDFISLALEYAPPDDVLKWANQVLSTNLYRRAIVVSHWIIRPGPEGGVFTTPGQRIYDALKTNSNLFVMFCGHEVATARRRDTFQGNTVETYLNDYEAETNGGNGWLRVVNFFPSNNLVDIRTYSPWVGAYKTGLFHSWSFPYDMSLEGKGYIAAGSVETNGSSIVVQSAPLSNLDPNTCYEWYVQVDTGTSMVRSEQWQFYSGSPEPRQNPYGIVCSPDKPGRASFSWNSVGGLRYRIEMCEGTIGNWRELVRPDNEEIDSSPPGANSVQFFIDDFKYTGGPPSGGTRFFRIRKIDQNP